jgi:hypothetical protein
MHFTATQIILPGVTPMNFSPATQFVTPPYAIKQNLEKFDTTKQLQLSIQIISQEVSNHSIDEILSNSSSHIVVRTFFSCSAHTLRFQATNPKQIG